MPKNTLNKNIILGVTGGIASYKSCEIVRLLVTQGAVVHVVMTKSATEFVTPMTFQALSQNPVRTGLFDLNEESKMNHIQLADTADLVIIAPATANILAKAAHGICDDLLSTILVVTRAPLVFAPSMNVHMWQNKMVQNNVSLLKKNGCKILGPTKGDLACGYKGEGRMVEPGEILDNIKKILS